MSSLVAEHFEIDQPADDGRCKACRGSGIVVRMQTAEAREPNVTWIAFDKFGRARPALNARFVSYFCSACNGKGIEQKKQAVRYFTGSDGVIELPPTTVLVEANDT